MPRKQAPAPPTRYELPFARGRRQIGQTGLTAIGGYIQEEYDPDLKGIRGIRVYEEMRRSDPIVSLGLRAVKWVVGQVPWRAEAGGDSATDKAAADFLGSCLSDMRWPWSRFIYEALSCLDFGWSWFEIIYKQRAHGDPSSAYDDGRLGWDKLMLIGHSSLDRWELDPQTGDILGLHQRLQDGTTVLVPRPKSAHFRMDAEKNNPEGVSLLRAVYLPWYKKRQIEEVEAIGIERDLTGTLVITPPVGSGQAEYDLGQAILEQYRSDDMLGLYAPRRGANDWERWMFEIINSPGNKQVDSHTVIQRYGMEIARSFMAQFMMLGAQGTQGSWALSREQHDLFDAALGAVLRTLEETVNSDLVAPLFRLNPFGKLSALPKLRHGRIPRANIQIFAAALRDLQGSGFLTPDEGTETFVREDIGLPRREGAPINVPKPEAAGSGKQPDRPSSSPTPRPRPAAAGTTGRGSGSSAPAQAGGADG